MGVAERIKTAGRFDVDAFMAFYEDRPHGERWQLVDGVALLMSPPSFVHQRIAGNLLLLLNTTLPAFRPELFAYGESGVRLPARRDFQPEPDIVVTSSNPPEGCWTDDYTLIAEVLSPSNSREMIDRKIELYTSSPTNLHVIMIAQDAVKVVHRARSGDWRPDELGDEDRLVVPEFGLDAPLLDLYRGTKLDPR